MKGFRPDGAPKWEIPVPGVLTGPTVAADGAVFLGQSDLRADRHALVAARSAIRTVFAVPEPRIWPFQKATSGPARPEPRRGGEEAVEVVTAEKNGERDREIAESADLLYHWLVMLAK